MPLMIRGFIIYIVIIASVRIMGKRQIGELQPSELVITILLSQIASMPLENSETSLIESLVAIFLLVALEIIFSVLAIKSRTLRNLLQGHSVLIIEEGKIVEKNLKLLRLSIEDLIEALRLKDVFDVTQVEYAYVETNGTISLKLKSSHEALTLEDLKIKKKSTYLDCLVLSDGKIIEREFSLCGIKNKEEIENILFEKGLKAKDVLLMTYSKDGKSNIILKGGDKWLKD